MSHTRLSLGVCRQSPLDNPNSAGTVRDSRNLRLFKARLNGDDFGSTRRHRDGQGDDENDGED